MFFLQDNLGHTNLDVHAIIDILYNIYVYIYIYTLYIYTLYIYIYTIYIHTIIHTYIFIYYVLYTILYYNDICHNLHFLNCSKVLNVRQCWWLWGTRGPWL